MKTIHKYFCAVVLAVSALAVAPSPALAQGARGSFTLAHTVHWQNAIVPAGTYRFKLAPKGPAEMLTLSGISDPAANFMILVLGTEDSKPWGVNKLELVTRPSGSFVSVMELPEYGVTLRFPVPAETREVALAATPVLSATR